MRPREKSGPTPHKKDPSGARRRQRRKAQQDARIDQARLDWLEGSSLLFGDHFEHVVKERGLLGSRPGGSVRCIIDAARQLVHELARKAREG